MNIWRRFRNLSFFKQILFTVLLFHMMMLSFLLIDHVWNSKKSTSKKIAIRTITAKPISLQAPPPQASPQNSPGLSKPVASPKVASPKKQSSETKEKKRNDAKKREIPIADKKSCKTAEQTALLAEIAQNLEILNAPRNLKPSASKLRLPSSIPQHIEIEEEVTVNPSYGEALGYFLQQTLDLPEYGEVRAKLTIDASGTLLSVEILETRSKKNSEFLKKRLPDLTFPCFNDFGILETVHNFTITFTNVENP